MPGMAISLYITAYGALHGPSADLMSKAFEYNHNVSGPMTQPMAAPSTSLTNTDLADDRVR